MTGEDAGGRLKPRGPGTEPSHSGRQKDQKGKYTVTGTSGGDCLGRMPDGDLSGGLGQSGIPHSLILLCLLPVEC